MKILAHNKIPRLHLAQGDTLAVVSRISGKSGYIETTLVEKTLKAEHAMVVDEAVLFETVFENRRALGGLVLEAN